MMMLLYVIRIFSRLYIMNRDTQHIHVSEAVFQKKQRKEIPYELNTIMNGIVKKVKKKRMIKQRN